MKSLLCVINKKAANGSVLARLPQLEALFKEFNLKTQILDLTEAGFEDALVDCFESFKPSVILGGGGDGTQHSLVNTLEKFRTLGHKIPAYAICPFGTGNDVAKSIGLRPGKRHLKKIIAAAVEGKACDFDVGYVNEEIERHFVDMTSFGLDVQILKRRDTYTRKIMNTPFRFIHGYIIYFFAVLMGLKNSHWNCRILLDGKEWYDGKFACIMVNNCRIHAGEFDLTPNALFDDGLLDICLMKSRPAFMWRYIKGWRHMPAFIRERKNPLNAQAKEIKIISSELMPLQIDGELYPSLKSSTLTVISEPMKMLRPQ